MISLPILCNRLLLNYSKEKQEINHIRFLLWVVKSILVYLSNHPKINYVSVCFSFGLPQFLPFLAVIISRLENYSSAIPETFLKGGRTAVFITPRGTIHIKTRCEWHHQDRALRVKLRWESLVGLIHSVI